MNLVLTNYEVKSFGDFIHSLVLNGKESRWRTKLYNLVAMHHNEVNGFEYELLKEYANLDEEGQIKFLDEKTGTVDMDDDKVPTYRKHLAELLNEELIIPCDEEHKRMLTVVATIILDGEFEVNPELAGFYALWCDKFEEVLDFYEEK